MVDWPLALSLKYLLFSGTEWIIRKGLSLMGIILRVGEWTFPILYNILYNSPKTHHVHDLLQSQPELDCDGLRLVEDRSL